MLIGFVDAAYSECNINSIATRRTQLQTLSKHTRGLLFIHAQSITVMGDGSSRYSITDLNERVEVVPRSGRTKDRKNATELASEYHIYVMLGII